MPVKLTSGAFPDRALAGTVRSHPSTKAVVYFGSDFTSLSHLASKRLRSAEEPYFLKS